MLVLSRKKNEKIVIDDRITIMVIEIRGDKVRLGIDAPRSMTVHRQEVVDAIKRQQRQCQKCQTSIPVNSNECPGCGLSAGGS